MEFVAYGGFPRCARLVSGDVEALVTTDVGPRIIRLGVIGGRNEFHENDVDMGQVGGDIYRSYGGHRLWISPEDKVRTYHPENEQVECWQEGEWVVFSPTRDPWGVRKELCVKPTGDGGFEIEHRIRNQSNEPMHLAPWAITVMTTGGSCYIPQNAHKPFPEVLVPVGAIALWNYTNMADPRLTWGKNLIRLRQDCTMGPTKIGAFVDSGYACYHNGPNLFVKRFGAENDCLYPDFCCNFETFTRHDMLECESLGPMQTLAPGECAIHLEQWKLFANVALPSDEEGLYLSLKNYADLVMAQPIVQ
jgi:hypothetical protein